WGDGDMRDSGDRVAAIGGAGVAIIYIGGSTGDAGASPITDLLSIADARIRARSAPRSRAVLHTRNWIAAVEGAGVAVLRRQGRSGSAAPRAVAKLMAVAYGAVRTRASGSDGLMRDAGRRVAAIGGA